MGPAYQIRPRQGASARSLPSSPCGRRGPYCGRLPPRRRAAAGTFPLLSRPHAPPLARTKTRAAARPAGSRRSQAPITRPPAAPIGPLLADLAPIGWRQRPCPQQGAVYFGLPARPAQGRSLRGAPPLPRLPCRAEAEPRGKEGRGVRREQTLGTPPPAAHVQPPPHAELLPRSIAACRSYGTMHSPGSTGPGDGRAVSDGAERGTRRGTREGWRLLAAVGAADLLWSGQGPGGSAGSGWRGGCVSAAACLQLCLLSAAAPPGAAISSHDVTRIQRRTAVGCGRLAGIWGRSQSWGAAWGRGESG